ncbi:hypothetical protein T01_10885 [Trichinella spiralis]|uniref:Uncharacterized protein n=1 Tax=Trichinella spiralis TaxID=6334 RepID=A0A0V1BFV8_TRISP|nr:hypothetical protein T01_10885 [Trichinella spiralis]
MDNIYEERKGKEKRETPSNLNTLNGSRVKMFVTEKLSKADTVAVRCDLCRALANRAAASSRAIDISISEMLRQHYLY